MRPHLLLRESGRDNPLQDVRGEIMLTVERDGKRPAVWLAVQVTAKLDGQDVAFWLRRLGPVADDRVALQHRFVEPNQGGFYCYDHQPLENLALAAWRKDQATWRFVAVADLTGPETSGPRIEIDTELNVATNINWLCG